MSNESNIRGLWASVKELVEHYNMVWDLAHDNEDCLCVIFERLDVIEKRLGIESPKASSSDASGARGSLTPVGPTAQVSMLDEAESPSERSSHTAPPGGEA